MWVNDKKVVVMSDPIRQEEFTVQYCEGSEQVLLLATEVSKRPPRKEKLHRHHARRKNASTDPINLAIVNSVDHTDPTDPANPTDPATSNTANPDSELDYLVYVLENSTTVRIGKLIRLRHLTNPVLVNRIFSSSGNISILSFLCSFDNFKVVSVLHDFQISVDTYVESFNLHQFSLTSVASSVYLILSKAHLRLSACQERNLGLVSYVQALRHHSLGAQMRQAVASGISVNATWPAQQVILGVFDPFHDAAIFGLLPMNKFKGQT